MGKLVLFGLVFTSVVVVLVVVKRIPVFFSNSTSHRIILTNQSINKYTDYSSRLLQLHHLNYIIIPHYDRLYCFNMVSNTTQKISLYPHTCRNKCQHRRQRQHNPYSPIMLLDDRKVGSELFSKIVENQTQDSLFSFPGHFLFLMDTVITPVLRHVPTNNHQNLLT